MTKKNPGGKTGRPLKIPGEKSTREKIFDAAVDLFAERGYDRTTVRDIAGAVGITESAVYRHYPSKESILEAIFTYVEKRVYTPLPPARSAGRDVKSSVFREMLEGLPRYLMADPYLLKIIHIFFIEMHHNEKIRDSLKKEYGERADEYTERVFRKHMEEGTIRPCDPRALAKVFNAFRFAWLYQTFIFNDGKPLKIDEMEKDLEGPIELFEKLLIP
jgi:AcrR family transcriptional regulator